MTPCKVTSCLGTAPPEDMVCPRHRRELNRREREQIERVNMAIWHAMSSLGPWATKYTWQAMADAERAYPDDYKARWEMLKQRFKSQAEVWWPERVNDVS